MTASSTAPIAKTNAGELRGTWHDGVAAFRGIPYAAPPVGPLRFAPPAPGPRWDGIRSAERQAVAPPQPPSRGEAVMGPMDVPGQDEDCLTLNVWTPAPGSTERLPVLVWFHGGGFLFGAGSASWYDGTVMARRGRMVVVSVSYRLGALGWLYLPEGMVGPSAVANLGLQDQCQALEWVRDNVAAFGGDPDRVTVAGQSAGGASIVGLHTMPRGKGLFRRAIVQSSGPAMPARSREAAEEVTGVFLAAAGVAKGDRDALLSLSVSKILEAQMMTMMQRAMAAGFDPRLRPGDLAAPFHLVVDGEVLPEDPVAAARSGSMDRTDLLILCTPEEMRFALAFDDAFWKQDRGSIVPQLERAGGPQHVRLFEAYAALDPAASPAALVCDMTTDENCVVPSIELAERRAAIGRPAYFAWFTWRSSADGGRLGACHTIELPFVFDNFEHWTKAPMLAGRDPAELRALGDRVQDAWIAFAASGVPSEEWPAYSPPQRAAMEFGTAVGVIHAPAGDRRALWLDQGRPSWV